MRSRTNHLFLRRRDQFKTHMAWGDYVQNITTIGIISASNRRTKITISFGDWSGKTYSTYHYFITYSYTLTTDLYFRLDDAKMIRYSYINNH